MLMPLFISTTIATDKILKGEIISEGDIATAFCSSCFTEVTIRYEYLHFRSFRSESGDLMMGACTECGKLISVPAQAAPLLLEPTTERKLYTIELRLPRPLIDILRLVASYFNVPHDRFRSALLRYYVEELLLDHSLIVRVMRLARSDLAQQKADARFTFRLTEEAYQAVYTVLYTYRISNCSMMMRGLILAAAEDAFSHRSNRRRQAISAIVASLA